MIVNGTSALNEKKKELNIKIKKINEIIEHLKAIKL